MSWREALVDFIRKEALPVEKFSHQPRLVALTQQIAQEMQTDEDILFAAAYLHDLGVFYGHRPSDPAALAAWDNTAYAVAEAPAILALIGFPAEKIDAVLYCIANHQPHTTPEMLEAILLRDADILEQLGAVGILRTVCKVGRDTRFHTFADAAQSLQRALDTLPQQIRLDATRALARPRIALLKDFLASLQSEAMGEL
jgi:uncharacterized protein